MTHPPCRPHPTSRTCMVQGDHLAGCDLSACRGCVACDRHNPRPAQVPAATSDARKRHQDARNAALMARARESLAGGKTFELPTPTRDEDR